MPTNLYGPGDNFDLESAHVLPALIRRFHDAKMHGRSRVTVWGTGSPRREFLHVDDLADACVFLMQRYESDDTINVGTGENLTIRELAERVRDVVVPGVELAFDTSKLDGTPASSSMSAVCVSSAGATGSGSGKGSPRPRRGAPGGGRPQARLSLLVLLAACGPAEEPGSVPSSVAAESRTDGTQPPAGEIESWLEAYHPQASEPGYNLILYRRRYPMLIDMNGNLVHVWRGVKAVGRARLLADGSLLVISDDGAVRQLSWEGELRWEYRLEGDGFPHHDAIELANGNRLLLFHDVAQRLDYLLEVTPAGEVAWECHAAEHLQAELDRAGCPRRMLAGDLPQPPEADPRPLPEGLSRPPKIDDPVYSIRVAESPGTLCAACGKQETGAGPAGYMEHEPICDLCLLERSTDLGLILATIAVVRAYAATGGKTKERQGALDELGVFARIYHRVASKSWPARIFRIPGFTARNDTTH